MGRKAFSSYHLAAGAQGAGAGGEGENSFSVYPLVGRRRRLNQDQKRVCKPGRERRATFATSAHHCKSFFLKADENMEVLVLGCTGNPSTHHQASSNVDQNPSGKQLYIKGFVWDWCSAAEGFVMSKGATGRIPGDEKPLHFNAQGWRGLGGISLELLLCNPRLCFPAGHKLGAKSMKQKGSLLRGGGGPVARDAQHHGDCSVRLRGRRRQQTPRQLGKFTNGLQAIFNASRRASVAARPSERKLSTAPKRLKFGLRKGSNQPSSFPPPEGTFAGSLGIGRDPCSRAAWGLLSSHPTP